MIKLSYPPLPPPGRLNLKNGKTVQRYNVQITVELDTILTNVKVRGGDDLASLSEVSKESKSNETTNNFCYFGNGYFSMVS